MKNETLELAKALIARKSITPEDAGCQQLIIDRLVPLEDESSSSPPHAAKTRAQARQRISAVSRSMGGDDRHAS